MTPTRSLIKIEANDSHQGLVKINILVVYGFLYFPR